MKKGLSFTLTLVVVGVILLMTALSVITLGGSSLNSFFNTAQGQQDEAEIESAVQQRCEDMMGDIQQNYCSEYIVTAEYRDTDGPSHATSPQDYNNASTGSEWDTGVQSCATTQSSRVPRSYDLASSSSGERTAYSMTASEAGCDWQQFHEPTPTVTYEGQDYSCTGEYGNIQDTTCPAQ